MWSYRWEAEHPLDFRMVELIVLEPESEVQADRLAARTLASINGQTPSGHESRLPALMMKGSGAQHD